MLATVSLSLSFASPLSPPKIPDTFTAVITSTTSGTSHGTVPKGKATFRSFAGQRHSATATSKRGGGGRFNWGNPLDVTDEDVDWDDLGEVGRDDNEHQEPAPLEDEAPEELIEEFAFF